MSSRKMANFENVWKQVLSLNDQERARIALNLKALGATGTGTEFHVAERYRDVRQSWLFRGYEFVFLQDKGLTLGYKDAKAFKMGKGLEAQAWFEKHCGKLTETQKIRLGRIAAAQHLRWLADRARIAFMLNEDMQSEPSVTPEWVFRTLSKMPIIIDDGLPGYVRNGLLSAVVKGLPKGE